MKLSVLKEALVIATKKSGEINIVQRDALKRKYQSGE